MNQEEKEIVRQNLLRIDGDKYNKPRRPTCQGCSRCCNRVISTTKAEIKAVENYLKEHPEIRNKIIAILKMVPETADVCPFLDLSVEGPERCMLYKSSVRFYICTIFSCCFGSSYPEQMEEWAEEHKHSQDPTIACDLRFQFFGAKKNMAPEAETREKIYSSLF